MVQCDRGPPGHVTCIDCKQVWLIDFVYQFEDSSCQGLWWDTTRPRQHLQPIRRARKGCKVELLFTSMVKPKWFKPEKDFSRRDQQVNWTWVPKSVLIYSNFMGNTQKITW